MEKKPIKVQPLNYHEYDMLRRFTASTSEIMTFTDSMKQRLQNIPTAYRDARCISGLAKKLMENMLMSVPYDKRSMLKSELPKFRVQLKLAGAVPCRDEINDTVTVMYNDFKQLVTTACAKECDFCEKKGKKVKSCPTYKLLKRIDVVDCGIDTLEDGSCIFTKYSIGDDALKKGAISETEEA